jgi:hypothetical protein
MATKKPYEQNDISADLGNIDTGKPVEMYSYERPANILWQGVYDGLRSRGMSHRKAVEWLQSRETRWLLDGELGATLTKLGNAIGAAAT